MKTQLIIIALFLLSIAQPLAANEPTVEPTVRDGAFIHLSAGPEAPHRVLMALKMAIVMAEGGKDVLIYCDIKAVNLLVEGAPDLSHNGFDGSKALLASLLEKKIPVRACPSCLNAAGKKPEDLLPGVTVADREEFFSFTKGRILTLDY